MQVLSECYVTFTRKINPAVTREEAWEHVRDLLTWNPQPTDVELLVRARETVSRHPRRGRPRRSAGFQGSRAASTKS
jgi:hypothetical protein